MKNIYLGEIAMIVVMGIVLVAIVVTSMGKTEAYECRNWVVEASKYSGYYITQWQADQCAAHNIAITAPIK